jgi:amino acid permease
VNAKNFHFSSKISIVSYELANLALNFSFFLTTLSSVVEDIALDSSCSIVVVSSQFKFANVSKFSSKHL